MSSYPIYINAVTKHHTSVVCPKVKNHPYVIENEDCRPLIIETLKFIYDLEMITQRDGEVTTPELARPRVPHEILFAIGGWSGGSPTNFIETYDTRADRWVKVSTGRYSYVSDKTEVDAEAFHDKLYQR